MEEASAKALDQRRQFEQIYDKYYGELNRYVLSLLRNKDDAEEITQKVFLRFFARMGKGQWETEVKNVKAYLIEIANNACKDLWKDRREEGQVSYDDEKDEQIQKELQRKAMQLDDSTASIQNRILYGELYRDLPLNVILSGFSDYEIELIQLRKVDELSPKEIASTLDKDVYQVRYDLNKLDAKIRYRVRRYLEGNGGSPL